MLKSKECFVVLGNLMNKDGALNSESRGRVLKLHDALKNKTKPELIFFVVGSIGKIVQSPLQERC